MTIQVYNLTLHTLISAVTGSAKLVTFVCGQLHNKLSVNPVYAVAQSAGSSHLPNLSTLTVNFLHSHFPLINNQCFISNLQLPFMNHCKVVFVCSTEKPVVYVVHWN